MKFIYGEEQYQINNEIKKIISQFPKDGEVVEFVADDDLDTIISHIINISMFSSEKLIIIKDHPIFFDNDLSLQILQYIKNEYKGIEFVFVLYSIEIKKTNKLISYILAKSDVKKFPKINSKNLDLLIRELVSEKGAQISNTASLLMASRLPANMMIIMNEIEKLILFTKDINEDHVMNIVSKYTNDDFFSLSNAILSGDVKKIIKSYQDRKSLGDDEIFIISQIASILESVIICNSYRNQGYTNSQISQDTKIHPFKITKSLEMVGNYSIETISSLYKDLTKLDFEIKNGITNKEQGLYYFILKIIQ